MNKSSSGSMEMNLFTDFPQEPPKDIFLHPIPHAIQNAVATPKKKVISGGAAMPKPPSHDILQKITDFGKETGFARKDACKQYVDELRRAGELDIKSTPMGKLWPKINYTKAIKDTPNLEKQLALVRSLREAFPKKPHSYSYDMNRYCDCFNLAQSCAVSVLSQPTDGQYAMALTSLLKFENDAAQDMNRMGSYYVKRVQDLMDFYEACGHEQSLGNYYMAQYRRGDQTVYAIKEARNVDYMNTYGIGRGRDIVEATTREACISKLADYIAEEKRKKTASRQAASAPAPAPKHIKFDLYCHYQGTRKHPKIEYWFLAKKINGQLRTFKTFETREEAATFRRDHADELDQMFADWKKTPEAHPDLDIFNLKGKHHDGPVTMEDFDKTFGFKAVEFGNWVDDKTRQQDLNLAYDAFIDLANVLHIPPKAVSLNGDLALLFGCNGRSKFSAHYEHANIAINLTKTRGAGTFAHEWYHALDHYFQRLEKEDSLVLYSDTKDLKDRLTKERGNHFKESVVATSKGEKYIPSFEHEPIGDTASREGSGFILAEDSLREEIKEAFTDTQYAISASGIPSRSEMLETSANKYWTKNTEMGARAFEAVVQSMMKEQGIEDPYLVHFLDQKSWDEGTGKKDSYPYPTEEELPYIREAYEKLISVLRYQETEKGIALYSADDYAAVDEMQHITHPVREDELGEKEYALRKFSEDVFGIRTEFFHGDEGLHGLFSPESNIIYLNVDSNKPLDETLWHEAFHGLRKADEQLYQELLQHTETSYPISQEQIDAYKMEHNLRKMNDDTVKEELLAEAFSKAQEREIMLRHAPNQLARKVLSYTLSFKDKVQGFFHEHKGVLTKEQFHSFEKGIQSLAKSVDTGKYSYRAGRILEAKGQEISARKPLSDDGMQAFLEAGITNLYSYDHDRQKQLDTGVAIRLLKTNSQKDVQKIIQTCSPFGQKESYVRDVMKSATRTACR